MKKIIAANWKMNPKTVKEAKILFQKVSKIKSRKTDIVIAPPFVYIPFLKSKNVKIGSQDVFIQNAGPYTGEVSPSMLKSVGVKYVIVGHSERRLGRGESNELINKKIKSSLESGLKVIAVVGETERNSDEFWKFLKKQIKESLRGVKRKYAKNLIIAYEPVWAISTSKNRKKASPQDIFEATIFIRRTLLDIFGRKTALATRILYGGSVEPQNAKDFLEIEGISGALVGGSSLDAEKFKKIIKAAEQV